VSSCTLPWEPPAVQCLTILLPQRGAMRTCWRNLPSTNSCLVDRRRSAAGHSCLPWDGKFDSRCWPGELLARDRCTVHGAARRPMLGPPQILVWVISAPLTDGVLGSGALEKNGAAQAPVSAAREWPKGRRQLLLWVWAPARIAQSCCPQEASKPLLFPAVKANAARTRSLSLGTPVS
jgi:hypothetical protein